MQLEGRDPASGQFAGSALNGQGRTVFGGNELMAECLNDFSISGLDQVRRLPYLILGQPIHEYCHATCTFW
jgi:hypothetical protein